MQTYFLALLATAAVLLGIAIAFLVGFIQMAGGRFTPAIASRALRDRWILSYLAILTIILIVIGVASLILSLPPPHLAPPLLGRDAARVVVAAAGLVLVIIDLGVVALSIGRASGYVNAPRLAAVLVRNLRLDNLVDVNAADDEDTEKVGLALLPLYELLNYAVRGGDRVTFGRVLAAVEGSWKVWLQPPAAKQRIVQDAVRAAFLNRIPELVAQQGVPSLHELYLPAAGRLARLSWDVEHTLLTTVLDHLCRTTVGLILGGDDTAAAYGVLALFSIETHVASDDDGRDDTERALGTVGRAVGRLLPASGGFQFDTGGIGTLDESASDVMAALSNGYWRLCDARVKAADPEDRCIWLEAIEVTCVALLERGIETENYGAIEEHTVDLLADGMRAVSKLVYAGCVRAGTLWVFALDRMTRLGIASDRQQLWSSLATYVAGIGAMALEVELSSFMPDTLPEYMLKAFERVPAEYWRGAIQEFHIRGFNDKPGHAARWKFITEAGKRCHTSFGLMFDETTGELYADDDPRRR